jgi:hypothetical protein
VGSRAGMALLRPPIRNALRLRDIQIAHKNSRHGRSSVTRSAWVTVAVRKSPKITR